MANILDLKIIKISTINWHRILYQKI